MNRTKMRGMIRSALMRFQQNECTICGMPLSEEVHENYSNFRPPRIDHNHQTYQIRGVVCDRCNTRIGQYERNAKFKNPIMTEETREKIEEYLKSPPASQLAYLLNNPYLILYKKERHELDTYHDKRLLSKAPEPEKAE